MNQLKEQKSSVDLCVIAPIHSVTDTRIGQKELKTLTQAGLQVCVLCATEETPPAGIKAEVRQAWFPQRLRLFRWLATPLLAAQAIRTQAKVYYLHNPDTLPLAILLRVFGKRVVYETHEDYSARIMLRTSIPRPIRTIATKVVTLLESCVYRNVDAFVATQDTVKSRLGPNVLVLGNQPWVAADVVKPSLDIKRQPSSILRLIYVGGIWETRGLSHMIAGVNALQQGLKDESPSTDASKLRALGFTGAKLTLIGPGPGNSRAPFVFEGNVALNENIEYLGAQPHKIAMDHIRHSDIGLCLIQDVGDHRFTDPNKLYEYVQCGVPFVATNFPLWQQTFAAELGSFIDTNMPPNSDEFTKSIISAVLTGIELKNSGSFDEASHLFLQKQNWQVASEVWLSRIQQLVHENDSNNGQYDI